MAPDSSTLAWKIPWMEEPGRLQSMRSLRVGHSWATSLSLFTFMHWRRNWQPTPVFLPGESQGRGSLVGCRLWGRTESDTTEATQQQQQQRKGKAAPAHIQLGWANKDTRLVELTEQSLESAAHEGQLRNESLWGSTDNMSGEGLPTWKLQPEPFSSFLLLFSRSVVSDSLQPGGLQHARPPCPPPTPGACSDSCPSSQWCHPTISSSVVPLILPSNFPSNRVFSNVWALHIRWPKYWSISISPSKEYSELISFMIDWLDLLAVKGTPKSLLQDHSSEVSILHHLRLLYGPVLISVNDYWKNHSFDYADLCYLKKKHVIVVKGLPRWQ